MRTVFLAMVCLIVSSQALLAQAPAAPGNLHYLVQTSNDSVTPIASDTTVFPMVFPLVDDTLFNPIQFQDSVQLIISFDVTNISAVASINLNIGITPEGGEELNALINLDDYNHPSIAYQRSGQTITLEVGPFAAGDYIPAVRLANSQLQFSNYVQPSTICFINL